MRFTPLAVAGVTLVEPERFVDERGFFARVFCEREFAARDLEARFVQSSLSWNARAGTLRGLHWQAPPHLEAKLVRCTAGALWDVAVDLRPESPTFRRWAAAELTAENRAALFIPRGCAHGFVTLADSTEILYLISDFWEPRAGRGARHDDPAFGIDWPLAPRVIHPRDRDYPDWDAATPFGPPIEPAAESR